MQVCVPESLVSRNLFPRSCFSFLASLAPFICIDLRLNIMTRSTCSVLILYPNESRVFTQRRGRGVEVSENGHLPILDEKRADSISTSIRQAQLEARAKLIPKASTLHLAPDDHGRGHASAAQRPSDPHGRDGRSRTSPSLQPYRLYSTLRPC